MVGQAIRAGDYELAMRCLERSYQDHDSWLLFFNVDPENDPVRSDPRFQAMIKKLGVGLTPALPLPFPVRARPIE